MINFQDFGLSDHLLAGIEEAGFERPTPIQEKVIPSLVNIEKDFIGLAQTGTGKTAAFSIPIIQNIDLSKPFIQALILTPTRELAKQIENQVKLLGKNYNKLKINSIYGGVSINTQISDLKKPPHILIATPGRLLDLIGRKVIFLNEVRVLVLDEADEMLRMGFIEDIKRIIDSIEGDFVKWMFSATFPKEIRKISKDYMRDPLELSVGSVNRTNQLISHEYTLVKGQKKVETLMRIFDADESMRGIVFCRTKSVTQKLADLLKDKGYGVEALHGDLSQGQRDAVMNRFRKNNINIVIATDVASRGIDVYDLNRIIHFDMPENSVNYTHRSGRTARAGKSGFSLVFVPPSGAGKLRHFEQQLKVKFQEAKIPSEREITILRMKKWANAVVDSQVNQRVDPGIYGEVFKTFADLSKEEIIEKFVMNWVSGLKNPQVLMNKNNAKQDGQAKNLKKEKSGYAKPMEANQGDYKNYYINLGYIDGITVQDMFELLCGVTGLKRHAFKNIEIHQKYTLFDAQKVSEKTLVTQMKGLKLGKRKIRVNRNHK